MNFFADDDPLYLWSVDIENWQRRSEKYLGENIFKSEVRFF